MKRSQAMGFARELAGAVLVSSIFCLGAGQEEEKQEPPGRPVIERKGTIDLDLVEAHYFEWKGRLLREEWARRHYKDRAHPEMHLQIRDAMTGERITTFAMNHHFGTVFVEGETLYALGSTPSHNAINLFETKDLETWTQRNVITSKQFRIMNTSLIKVGDEYVLMFETDRPGYVSWAARFMTSKDLETWTLLSEEHVYGLHIQAAPHCLRHAGGWYYLFHVRSDSKDGAKCWTINVVRSRDLKAWKESPFNPVMASHEDDRKLAPRVTFTEAQKQRIATDPNVNNSDIDVYGYQGRTIISYAWGNQKGIEHLAEAECALPLEDFLEGWFPPGVEPPSADVPDPKRKPKQKPKGKQ
jgi:hypothetical protein